MSWRKQSWFFVFLLWCIPSITQASVSLAEWTFPNNPDDNLVDTSTLENSTEIIQLNGATGPTFENNGATTKSARGTKWREGHYWFFQVNTKGYQDIQVSVKLQSPNSGPKDFSLQYRLNNEGAWLDVVGGTLVVKDNFTTGTLESLTLPENTHDQERVNLRLVVTSPYAVKEGVILNGSADSSNRLDDLIVTGIPITQEEEGPIEPGNHCTGPADSIRINEILPYPLLSNQEYAELFNVGNQCVNLSGWRLEDASAHKYIFPVGSIIESQEYYPIIQNLYLNNTTPDSLTLYNQENDEVSQVQYEKAIKGLSLSFDNNIFRFTSYLTPGTVNIFDEKEDDEVESLPGSGVILNEIFPNPPQDEATNEFIELKNITDEEKDLTGWSLMDASQKIFTFPEDTLIPPSGLLAVPRSTFGFSLNNTGRETITLLDPQGNTLSEAEYTTTQENFSYSWNDSEWLWTKNVTSGQENEFSKSPKLTLTSRTTGYKDIPLTFKINIKNGKGSYKYSWDFGNGRKSTLAEPKHTFTETGNYKASVTVRGENGTAQKDFTITIKKYPTQPVLITALHPNPSGTDTGKEWIEIKNFSKKKIDLTGWSIGSGSDELTNHPLTPGIILLPNQSLRLTKSHASFSLVNSSGSVELRYPNKKSSSRVQYEEKEVPEDSTCLVINERCDFPESTKKKNASSDEESGDSIKKFDTEQNRDALTEGSKNPDLLPTKKEILQRIGTDFNLLMNQVLLDSFFKK